MNSFSQPTPAPWSPRTEARATFINTEHNDVIAAARRRFADSSVAVALTTAAKNAGAARVLWVNAAFLELTRYKASEIIGRSALLLLGARPDPLSLGEIELIHDHDDQNPFGIVSTKERVDGSHYVVEEHITAVRDAHGAVTHHLVFQVELSAH